MVCLFVPFCSVFFFIEAEVVAGQAERGRGGPGAGTARQSARALPLPARDPHGIPMAFPPLLTRGAFRAESGCPSRSLEPGKGASGRARAGSPSNWWVPHRCPLRGLGEGGGRDTRRHTAAAAPERGFAYLPEGSAPSLFPSFQKKRIYVANDGGCRGGGRPAAQPPAGVGGRGLAGAAGAERPLSSLTAARFQFYTP